MFSRYRARSCRGTHPSSATSVRRRAAFATLALAALSTLAGNAGARDRHSVPSFDRIDRGGVIYAMTNDSDGNEILVFLRDRHGRLQPARSATAETGGAGSNFIAVDPLGSQNALVYDDDLDMLFAVNAGDNTVTAFEAGPIGLPLRRRALVPSGGYIPVSVAVSEHLLYVLNAGDSGTVATFDIGPHGQLTQIGSFDLNLPPMPTAPPFDRAMAPGQVGVDALARHLIVTYGQGQQLLVAELDDQGVPVAPLVATTTPGAVPFAFGVTRYGTTLLAEASGSVSAFDPPAGTMPLTATATAISTGQTATCWIVVHENGFAYVSNTGSDSLSLFGYTRTGSLQLLDDVAATPEGAPIDMTFANDGRFLYTLNAASGRISGYAIDQDTGALTEVETQGGLPASAGIQGIAARDF